MRNTVPRKTLILALTALVAAVLIWFATRDTDRGAVAPQTPSVQGPTPSSSSVELVEAARPPEPSEESLGDSPEAADETRSGREQAAAPELATLEDGLRVLVVHGLDGPPVADAQVRAGTTPATVQRPGGRVISLPPPRSGTRLESIVAGRPSASTDAQGIVIVPAHATERVVVVAQQNELWGHLVIDADPEREGASSEPHVLVLKSELDLVARVVDLAGLPVGGAPVQLQCTARFGVSRGVTVMSAPESGVAHLPHVQLQFASQPDASDWRIALDVLAPDAPAVAIDPGDLPLKPVLLVMPPVGALDVELLDAEGEPMLRGGSIVLSLPAMRDPGAPEELNALGLPKTRVGHRPGDRMRMVMGATTRFEYVGLGQELEVQLTRGFSDVRASLAVLGPTQPGETVHAVLRVGAEAPVVRLHVFDPEGRSVVNQRLMLQAEVEAPADLRPDFISSTTDAEGRLMVELREGWGPGRLHLKRGEDERATVTVGVLLPVGLTDLGDVFLERDPVIVSGIAVGPDGEGVEGLSIELSAWRGSGWMPLFHLPAQRPRTGAEGEFLLRGPHEYERYSLKLTGEDLRSQAVEFDVGTEGLVVPLATTGALAGSVWLPDEFDSLDGLAAENFVAQLLVPVDERRAGVSFPHQTVLDEDGGFLFESVQPGVYSFALKPKRGVRSLYQVEGVVIAPGPPTRDARLDPLDLRGTLHAWRLRFDGARRDETLSGSLRYGEAGSDERPLYLRVRSDELLLLSPFTAIDADLALHGYKPIELRGVQGDAVVQLEPGLPVRVVLTGQAALLEPPYGLSVALVPDEPGWHATDRDAAEFGDSRELVVACPEPGQRRVRWIVSRQRDASIPSLRKRTRSVDAEPLQVVEIKATAEEQRIEVLWTVQEADRLRALVDDR